MKLKSITIFCLLALAVSCTQQEVGEGKYITIEAAFPDQVESKVSVEEKDGDSGLTLSWEETDKIVVVGESVETFILSSIDGNKATFKGKKVQGDVFDVILSNSEDFERRSYLHQTQTGVTSTESLEYDACLKGVDSYVDVAFTEDWARSHGGELLQSGTLLVYFQLPVAAEIVTAVALETSAPVFNATNSESGLKSSTIEMEIENGKVAKENTVKAYFMTSVLETEIKNGTSFRLTVVTDNGTYYKDFTPGNVKIKPGKRNVIKLNSKNWQTLLDYKTYTFMTYNVGKFIKFENELGRRSYQDVASVINHYEADIVGLNEITSYQVTNNIIKDELASKIGAGWNYYSAIADEVTSGNGVVYSPNIHIISNTKIDLKCDDGNRSLGVFESDDFVFCVTHLDHNLETNRKEQIATINKWISDNYGSSEKPIILVGDMNAKPTGREIQSYLASNWQTISDTNTYTFVNSNGEKKCLDYIFLWKNDAVEYKVNKTEVIHTCPGVNVDLASDHYPVYAEIAFAKRYEVEELKDHIQTGLDRLSDTYIYEEKF